MRISWFSNSVETVTSAYRPITCKSRNSTTSLCPSIMLGMIRWRMVSGIQVVTEIGNLSIEVIGNEVPDSTGLRFPCGRLS